MHALQCENMKERTSSLAAFSSRCELIWDWSSGFSCKRFHILWAAKRLAIFLLLPWPISRFVRTTQAMVNCRWCGSPISISVSYDGGGQRRYMHSSWSHPIGFPVTWSSYELVTVLKIAFGSSVSLTDNNWDNLLGFTIDWTRHGCWCQLKIRTRITGDLIDQHLSSSMLCLLFRLTSAHGCETKESN